MLVIPNKRKLVLATSTNHEILAAIPHAKAMQHEGQHVVALHHGPEEAIVLKNLGIVVPEPIRSYYKWPGRFLPMDHQVDTAAFLTSNRRSLCLNAPGCVDADTEYLSPTGWRRMDDYAGGQVAQFDPVTGAVEFVDGEYVKLPCDDMVRIKTKYGVDQLLSPEHRCLIYSKRNTNKFEVLEAAELYHRERSPRQKSRSRVGVSEAAIKTTFTYGGPGIALTDEQLRVQVAVIADGHFPSSTARCQVRVKKQRKKDRLRQLLHAANIDYLERSVDYPTAKGFTVFTFAAPLRTKQFDARWYQCSAEQLRVVVDEVPHWDSSVSPLPTRGWRFSSYIRESADFVQFACAACGNTARILTVERERRDRAEIEYVVQVRPGVEMVGLKGGGSGETITRANSTDGYKYCFMVPSTFLLLRRNGCVFTTGNTGKTLSSLWAADFLMEEGVVEKVLIVCPKSTLNVVWGREIYQHLPHRSFEIVTGPREKRERLLETPGLQFAIINHDGFTNMADKLVDFGLVIYDEGTALKTPGSQRYRVFAKWMQTHNPWLWLLTGTPISQNPTDAWTLARLVNSPSVPRSYTAFRDLVMSRISTFKWAPRPEALDICKQVLQPSIRFSLDECKNLPDTLYVGRQCDMTPAQKRAFKEMEDKAVVFFGNTDISAANAAVMLSKLLQICGGVINDNYGQRVAVDAHLRYEALKELLDEIGDKAIVFCPLRGVIDGLTGALRTDGYDVECVHGDVSDKERQRIFSDFQHTDSIKVLLAHPKVAAHGLTLTRAKDIVWFLPIYSLEQYEQANARIRRLSTEGKTRVWHIYSTPFEKELYRRLQYKKRVLGEFLAMVRGVNDDV